jgi:hypothetical protein
MSALAAGGRRRLTNPRLLAVVVVAGWETILAHRRTGRRRAFFGKLSNSMQRYHVDSVTAAKSADTR